MCSSTSSRTHILYLTCFCKSLVLCSVAGDSIVATCAGDNQVRVHDVQTGTTTVFRRATVIIGIKSNECSSLRAGGACAFWEHSEIIMKQAVVVACCEYASSAGASLQNIEQHTDKQLGT